MDLALHHLPSAACGLVIVGHLGVGPGILATGAFAAGLRGGIDRFAAIAQGLAPVVVVALALPVLGSSGLPTPLALVAYGIMPTVRGIVGAIQAVSASVKDAVVAIGPTRWRALGWVGSPLGGAGILDALGFARGLAVGALAGASTLRTPIVSGLQNQNVVALFQGAAATAALAFLCDAARLAAAVGFNRQD